MKIKVIVVEVALMPLVASALFGQMNSKAARAEIYNSKGRKIGVARFTEVHGAGVKIVLDVSQLSAAVRNYGAVFFVPVTPHPSRDAVHPLPLGEGGAERRVRGNT